MCGIFGKINKNIPIDETSFIKQLSLLKHRGPDYAGCWFSGNKFVGLGHARLSILDLL